MPCLGYILVLYGTFIRYILGICWEYLEKSLAYLWLIPGQSPDNPKQIPNKSPAHTWHSISPRLSKSELFCAAQISVGKFCTNKLHKPAPLRNSGYFWHTIGISPTYFCPISNIFLPYPQYIPDISTASPLHITGFFLCGMVKIYIFFFNGSNRWEILM